jgi:ribosomal protein S6--L-glutamate ligase
VVPYFVSFHPDIITEENLALFEPVESTGVRDLLKEAAGVILPTYVPPWRYRAIVRCARNWFPRLDTRFNYRGKIKQILLFRRLGVRHPDSLLFDDPVSLKQRIDRCGSPWGYPLVLKGDTGGGGSRVYPVYAPDELLPRLEKLPRNEPALVQKWVDHGGRDLRVVVYGDRAVSYFRVGDGGFYNNVCRGGYIDSDLAPDLQRKGVEAVMSFCRHAEIDIAGFDLMFPDEGAPVFVEINFHFGRKGLGGNAGHRGWMLQAVDGWREKCLGAL